VSKDTKGEAKDPKLVPGSIDRIYAELAKLQIELDPDPLIYGPKRLNGKIAQARKMLGRCEEVFLQVSHDLHRFSRAQRLADTELKLRKDDLFANDPYVRAGKNVADREAAATVKLKPLVERTFELGAGVEELKGALTVVKAKRADLRDAAGRLRDQIRLCQEEIALGSKWGSRVPNAPDIRPSPVPNVSAIDDLVGGAEGETHLPQWKDEGDFKSPVHPDSQGSDDDGAIAKPMEPASLCSVCGEPQRQTPSGMVCKNGHGGVAPADLEPEPEPEAKPEGGHKTGSADYNVFNDPDSMEDPVPDPEPTSTTPDELSEDEVPAEEALPGTSEDDEIEAFLADHEPFPPKKQKRTQDELDEDLDDLLSIFNE